MLSTLSNVSEAYLEKIRTTEFEADPAQELIARKLDRLLDELRNTRLANKSSSLGWFFARKQKENIIKGAYIYGGVGRGKTMLMDMFYQLAPDLPKRRIHFHAYMRDIHERIGEWREKSKAGKVKGDDPIAPVAADIAKEAKLLCLDEMQVEDIADAMILSRLFTKLFERGVVLVTTSNVRPRNLYEDGLNRPLFVPFIDLLRQYTSISELDSETDYRLQKLTGKQVYFSPLNEDSKDQIEEIWLELAGPQSQPSSLTYKGRTIPVPSTANGVARFTFDDLCAKPLGAGDYLHIAEEFHTVFLLDVPILSEFKRNEARRLINLIDAFYDNHVRLVVSAESEPDNLYQTGDGAHLFVRTASRMIEMRSEAYLAGRI